MHTVKGTASLKGPVLNDECLFCTSSEVKADPNSCIGAFRESTCLLGYSHAQATAGAFPSLQG